MIHNLADVKSINIGKGTKVWQFAIILEGAIIGENCNINCHTFIENDVILGSNVTIKSGVYLWDGIEIHDDVFVGPNATFTNDQFPRSKQYPKEFQKTQIHKGATIGASAIIMGGCQIGEYSLIAAGALVTKNVPPYALMMGSPARHVGYVDKKGQKLKWDGTYYKSFNGDTFNFKLI